MDFPINGGTYPLIHRYERFNRGREWGASETRQRVTAGRGVEKVEPGSEKILGVGLNFKIRICPAHPRPGVGLEKLRFLCEAYAKSIKRDHK
jgi:hypothetical protein